MSEVIDTFEKLSAFTTADAIAAYLIEKGIKGEVEDGENCPITNLFLTETNAYGCTTTEEMITIEHDHLGAYEVKTTPIIREFIEAFDREVWPELVYDQGECDCWDCQQPEEYY